MVMDSRSRKPLQRAMGAVRQNRIYADEHCYVDEANPNTAFGYPSDASVFNDEGTQLYGVVKFATVLPQVINPTSVILTIGDISASTWAADAGTDITACTLVGIPILEDFDASTLTWDDLVTLSIGSTSFLMHIFSLHAAGNDDRTGLLVRNGSLVESTTSIAEKALLGSVYGLYFRLDFSTNFIANVTMDIERTALGTLPNAYHSYIEWTP